MLNKIFDQEELPNHKIYEAAQEVVSEYMERNNLKIDAIAASLNTTTGVLYRQLNPKDTQMPLSVDRVISISKLTGDKTIIEAIAQEFECVLIEKRQEEVITTDINLLVDVANIENSDVFKAVKQAISDGVITEDEKRSILKEIDEAEKANAQLKQRVMQLAIKSE